MEKMINKIREPLIGFIVGVLILIILGFFSYIYCNTSDTKSECFMALSIASPFFIVIILGLGIFLGFIIKLLRKKR